MCNTERIFKHARPSDTWNNTFTSPYWTDHKSTICSLY
jgi:hypothetical protein